MEGQANRVFQCALALILQVSEALLLLEKSPIFDALALIMENAVIYVKLVIRLTSVDCHQGNWCPMWKFLHV